MYSKGINMENVKLTNRACLLRLLFLGIPLSRTDISTQLTLTQATVTSICNDFLNQNLILQGESISSSKVGRKRCPLSIHYDFKHILTIDIHSSQITLSIVNLLGEPKAVKFLTLLPSSPESFFKTIAQHCIRLLWENHFSSSDILGAGVTTLGPVNQNEGISLHSFSLFDYPVNIKSILEKEFSFPVFVESNVCAYLRAELLFHGLSASPNALILKWGPGVGSASVIHGSLFKGYNHRSSELGHNYIDNQYGIHCKCGHVGCLETKISVDCIFNIIHALIVSESSPMLKNALHTLGAPSPDNLLQYLKIEDSVFQGYLKEASHALAVTTNNAIQILAPDKILLYGDVFESDDMVQLFIHETVSINSEISEHLFTKSKLNSKRLFIGAAAIVIEEQLINKGGFNKLE